MFIWKKNNKPHLSVPVIIFAVTALLILWQMVLPGYVLTMDMVFTPELRLYLSQHSLLNEAPLKITLAALSLILPGWFIQKLMLVGFFFGAPYLAYRCLPIANSIGKYAATFLYVLNPFVYERFLAGNLYQLFGYMLLPVFIGLLFSLAREKTVARALQLGVLVSLIGVFSVQFLAMSVIVSALFVLSFSLIALLKKNSAAVLRVITLCTLSLGVIALLTSYWVVPLALNPSETIIGSVSQSDLESFKTALPLQGGGVLFNVATMYGYWAENYPWVNYFLWPRNNPYLWYPVTVLFFALMAAGFIDAWRKNTAAGLFFTLTAIVSVIFAVGIADSVFKPFNQWLFDHVWLWRGFRDSQKWVGLLIPAYAYFFGRGVGSVAMMFKHNTYARRAVATGAITIVVLMTFTMVGGFARQLKPVWYPDSWHEANKVLNSDPEDFSVLVLPWHQYLSLPFNQNLITLNPAGEFFDKPAIIAQNIEIGTTYGEPVDVEVKAIEEIMSQVPLRGTDWAAHELRRIGVKYIMDIDSFKSISPAVAFEPALSPSFAIWFSREDLTIYEIMIR